MTHIRLLAAALSGVLLIPQLASALEVVAAAQLTGEYTDNTLRTEDNKIGEWIYQPGVDFAASQDSASLELDADYSYLRRIYQKDIWQDENRLVGGADLNWEAISERLDFLLRHNRRESTIQALQTQTQANRQIVNTTEAGATLRLQPRASDELQLEYTFTDIQTDVTQTDSQRHSGTGRYIVDLSPNRSLTLLGTYSDIEYDSLFFSEANYAVVSLGFNQTSNDLDLSIAVGYNWFERSGRGRVGDPAYDATLTWRPTAGSTVTLTGSHRITDQSQNLGERGSDIVDENTGINAAFKETLGDLGLQQAIGASNVLTLGGFYRREQYADDVPLSNTQIGARADFSRRMTPRTDLSLSATFANRDYEDQGDDQDEITAGVNLIHRFGRSVTLTLSARYEDRQAASSTSYQEWIGSAQILWTFWGAGRTL